MIRWGSTSLSVAAGTWAPYQNKPVLSETVLLPDPAKINAVCTVIQQGGRERYRVKATLMLSSMTRYTSLLTDKENASVRTLDDDDTVYGAYYIESLSPPKIPHGGIITAEIVFVEA